MQMFVRRGNKNKFLKLIKRTERKKKGIYMYIKNEQIIKEKENRLGSKQKEL